MFRSRKTVFRVCVILKHFISKIKIIDLKYPSHKCLTKIRTCITITSKGRTIAQAVSRWLITTAAWVWSSGICGGQSGVGISFL
jgi:hypothetical protein